MESVDFICTVEKDNHLSFPHFWEHTVGSGHATLALRADWQKQLLRCKKDLGFKHVRFHGILSDDVGTLVMEQDKLIYSFYNVDVICDFLISIGMKPFMELSFMPSTLSSGSDTVFHYKGNITPPKKYDDWGTLLKILVTHLMERYGKAEVSQWFFEIWNEPNLDAFWKASQAEYFKLYEYSVKAIKSVSPDLKVGGPATADNAWIKEFIDFAKQEHLSIDFISTHHYPTDAFGNKDDNTIEQLAKSKRSVLQKEAAETKSKAGKLPVYYTEWSTSSNPFDELHDMPYAAAFITKTVMEARNYVEGYSYWTFSDIFEENYFSSVPFHGGFGLVNIYGIPKPSYRAYELLHKLGDSLLPVAGSHTTVDVWVINKGNCVQVLMTNSALPEHAIKTEIIVLQINGLPDIKTAYVERIDDTHANARKAWTAMGQPSTLSALQVASIESESVVNKEPFKVRTEDSASYIHISIPPQGIACITLELNK